MRQTDAKLIWITGIAATAIAAILNALLVIIGVNLLGLNRDRALPPLDGPSAVVMFTVVFLLLATLVFWIIARRSPAPVGTFRTVTVIGLLVSFLPDLWLLTQPGAGPGEVILLMLTHVVAAAVIYGAFARRFA